MRLLLKKMKRPQALLSMAVLAILVYATAHALPTRHIRIAAGPVDGSYYEAALQYKRLIEAKGYQVEIVSFGNTDEIAAHVADDHEHFDIGFVAESRGGRSSGKLMSLGDIQLQPIFIFENRRIGATRPITSFADMRGMTLVLPPERSLTSRTLLRIFSLSGIDTQNTHIEFLPLNEGITRLKQGRFDAGLFMLGADSDLMADLAKNPDLIMAQVVQRNAIAKKLTYLKEVKLPAGIYDLEHNIPAHDVDMLAATISVVARRALPPATTYAVLEAMREVHRKSSYVNGTGDFPRYSGNAGQTGGLVDDFYLNGVPWIYSHLPVEFASVIDAYLAPLLALWLVTSALSVISKLEEMRFFAMVALARVALWWVHWRSRKGVALSSRTRSVIGKIESGIAKENDGIHDLLIELRKTIQA